jgi:uncharacterized protein YraI
MSTSRLIFLAGAVLALSLTPAAARIHRTHLTHTTANLNLRAGPGTRYPIRTVIPAGGEIDVHSCGHMWCYMSWAGHQGYVNHDYLAHHVTVAIPVIVHVTHVHYHSIF